MGANQSSVQSGELYQRCHESSSDNRDDFASLETGACSSSGEAILMTSAKSYSHAESPLFAESSHNSSSHSHPHGVISSDLTTGLLLNYNHHTNNNNTGQVNVKSTALSSASVRSQQDMFRKTNKPTKTAGKEDAETSLHESSNSIDMDLSRGGPARSSILRSSVRRPKVLNNVPPPIVPEEKFNRFSNASIGSSSGFGSGSSQDSTASSDSSGSSAPMEPVDSAARKARMSLKLSIISHPAKEDGFAVNGMVAGDRRFNYNLLPRSPLASPSPIYNASSSAAETVFNSPLSESASAAAVFRHPRPQHYPVSSFHPTDCYAVDSLKSPTQRSDYVELVCSGDPRHSRSSFSSFDGSASNYSNNSFSFNASHISSPSAAQAMDINAMFQAGMTDNEVLSAFLGSIGFTEYFPNFVQAGYDVATATRMTTEDLTAIGITKPNHRKRIRAELARLQEVDLNFGCDLPEDAVGFLKAVAMPDYVPLFVKHSCNALDKILNMTWEDFEDIGIHKLGHLKKLTLAVKHFRAVRRQTALSCAAEQEETNRRLSQFNSATETPKSDDDKSSSISRSSGGSPRKVPATGQVLSTFQASPKKLFDSRPKSALAFGRNSPLLSTPETDELSISWNADAQNGHHCPVVNGPVHATTNGVIADVAESHPVTTLPRRKSLKIGTKSLAKMMANVFRAEKGPSNPPSPIRDQAGPNILPRSPSLSSSTSSPSAKPPSPPTPLATFSSSKTLPNIARPPLITSVSRYQNMETEDGDNLSKFPPPPSPLLREYPSEEIDVDKTPTLPHRVLPLPINGHATLTRVERKSSVKSMPFAEDNIGTIRQRIGRNGPVMDGATFRDPSLHLSSISGGAAVPNEKIVSGMGLCQSEDTLDAITGMLADLSSELDEAMHQLEQAAH